MKTGGFTEGTELFNKADLFYSRRIGVQQIQSDNSELTDDEYLENMTKIHGY